MVRDQIRLRPCSRGNSGYKSQSGPLESTLVDESKGFRPLLGEGRRAHLALSEGPEREDPNPIHVGIRDDLDPSPDGTLNTCSSNTHMNSLPQAHEDLPLALQRNVRGIEAVVVSEGDEDLLPPRHLPANWRQMDLPDLAVRKQPRISYYSR
jgi:hypothetical protein